jgi:hypothetical protein
VTTTTVQRPTTLVQAGTGATATGGTINAVWADNLTTTYVDITGEVRTELQVTRVGFATPSPPAGSKIAAVVLRRDVRTVLDTDPQVRPNHYFRCNGAPLPGIGGAVQTTATQVVDDYFTSVYPTSTGTTAIVTETVGTFPLGPDGLPWDPAGNLNSSEFSYGAGNDIAGTTQRIYAVYLDIVYQQASVAAVTAPTGTVTTTSRPTQTATVTSPDAAPQIAYQWAIYSSAQFGAIGFTPFQSTPTLDSGKQLGPNLTWVPTDDLVNDTWHTYFRSWARYDGFGDFISNTASGSWTQSIAAAPTATLTSAIYDAVTDRTAIIAVPSSSSPVTVAFAFQVLRYGAANWAPVRTGLLRAVSGMTPVTVFDDEVELNVLNQYRVLAYANVSGVLKPAAAYSSVASVTAAQENYILFDPLNPGSKAILPVKDAGDHITQKSAGALFYPVAPNDDGTDSRPVAKMGPQYTPQGDLKMIYDYNDPEKDAANQWAKYQALKSSRRTLMLKKPNNDSLYVVLAVGGTGGDPAEDYRGARRPVWRDVTISYSSTAPPPVTS